MQLTVRIAFWVLVACLVAGAGPAAAGDTYVPDSNPAQGGSNSFPFGTAEIRCQTIFTPAQLGNKAFTITDISFANAGSGMFATGQFIVRMSHMTGAPSTVFANNLPNPVVVLLRTNYSINVVAKQWTPLQLNCPFQYNGVDNLTVEIRHKGGTSFPNGDAFTGSGAITRVYDPGGGSFNSPYGRLDTRGNKIRITYADVTPASSNPSIGTVVNLRLDSSADAGRFYVTASSFTPGQIPVGCWIVRLAPDDLFFLTATNKVPAMFRKYQGLLDANGVATSAVWIPALAPLVGNSVHTAFLVLDERTKLATVSVNGTFMIAR